ncbi:sensor histidine kinase [Streptacidiphilus sp. N1-12]|uniref:histidine kinase n=2 Tax=Streptacidiphilus alkalitolerans TaxID=3342712 RepID=A0ABV6VJU3_9ACTN
MRSRLLRISVAPAAVVALVGVGTVVYLLLAKPADASSGATPAVLGAAAAGSVLALFTAVLRARAADRRVEQRVEALRASSSRGESELWQLVEQLRQGEHPAAQEPEVPAGPSRDAFTVLGRDLDRYRRSATAAVVQASNFGPSDTPDQRVGVFVNLARRLQSLVHREIQLLDELEAQVEDPDLLKGLFSVDHLATRIRRHAENLAVLGGAVPRRQWSRPVTMYEVLRSAVAEVEHYSRVKLVLPAEGTLRGHAVADIVHLTAELVENATMFSAPNTQVLLRAQKVTAGVAIEVEDRGLGMSHEERRAMNSLLADPDRIDVGELLDDGRIGLFVVAALARRHGIAVQLQTNIYGGTQAVLVLPHELLGPVPEEQPARTAAPRGQTAQQLPPPVREPAPVPAIAAQAQAYAQVPAAPQYQAAAPAQAPAQAQLPAQAQNPLPVRTPETYPVYGHARTEPLARNPQPQQGIPDAPAPQGDHRPPLPRRAQQTHLAPQLRDLPTDRRAEPAAVAEADADYDPGLMAAFQRGVSRSEADAEAEATGGRPDADPRTS